MKNNNRPISDGLKGFPNHKVCVSGYPKKTKAEKTNKKYNKNKIIALINKNGLIALILFAGFLPALITISTYIFMSFIK